MTITIIPRGKAKRLRRAALRHHVSGHGKGRWHSPANFWRSKVKGRRLRLISAESRRRNRR